ncbi:purine/pyrimidine permease [Sporosarcina soli]|uniref:Purine/pyrimidine permease n=1 Tax=Sporosarcina soli TaxID=334736 RepID=A0ABW0TKN1_9BACL
MTVIGEAGGMSKLLKLFTPLVNGVYLTILGFQLRGMFLEGMMGVSDTSITIQPRSVIFSFCSCCYYCFVYFDGRYQY